MLLLEDSIDRLWNTAGSQKIGPTTIESSSFLEKFLTRPVPKNFKKLLWNFHFKGDRQHAHLYFSTK
jgi:hypothetical protein